MAARHRAQQDDPLVAVAVAGVVVADAVCGAVATNEGEAGAAQELAALVGLAQEEAAGLGLVDDRRRSRLPGLGGGCRVGGRGEAAGGDLGLPQDVADGIEVGELGDAVLPRVGVAGIDRGAAFDEGVAGAEEESAVGVDRLHVDGRRALPFRPVGDGDLAHRSGLDADRLVGRRGVTLGRFGLCQRVAACLDAGDEDAAVGGVFVGGAVVADLERRLRLAVGDQRRNRRRRGSRRPGRVRG